jgi:hypothetical protein
MLLIALQIVLQWIACGIFTAVLLFLFLQIANLAEYFVDKLK